MKVEEMGKSVGRYQRQRTSTAVRISPINDADQEGREVSKVSRCQLIFRELAPHIREDAWSFKSIAFRQRA